MHPETEPAAAADLRIDPTMLLLSPRVTHITYDPFVMFSVDDYLPREIYQALLDTFPGDRYFVGEANDQKHSHKRFFTSDHTPEVFQEFVRTHALWRQFFDSFASPEFCSDAYRLVRRGLVRSRGLAGLRRWRPAGQPSDPWAFWAQPVRPYYEFSQLGTGSHVLPHTDKASKLISMILYFPEQAWTGPHAGGTGFYRPKHPKLERNWGNRTVPFEELELFRGFDFVPNRLVVFLKSRNSYHAVPAVRCPNGFRRNTLNFNYIAPDHPLVRVARQCRKQLMGA